MKIKLLVLVLLFSSSEFAFCQRSLAEYIEIAKSNSPLITDNLTQVKANEIEARRIKAEFTKAKIDATANYLFSPIINRDGGKSSFQANPDNATEYSGYDLAYSNGGTYQAMLSVTQPLFNGKRYESASELLTANSLIAENTAQLTAHDLEKVIGDQYILCSQDLMQLEYINSMLSILEKQKSILELLVKNSIYKPSDLTLLNIEHQNLLIQQTTFSANYARDLLDLRILSGINDTSTVNLLPPNLVLNNSDKNSDFLEKYRLDSLNLVAQQNSFELKYRPQFNLFGNTGLNAVYAPTIPNRFGFSAGLSLSYPIFDGGQRNLNQEKTKVLQRSVAFGKENFQNQNLVRKTKILNELASFQNKMTTTNEQLKDYALLIESYKKEILSGQLTIINYLTVLKNMATAQRDYILLHSQEQLLINTYNYWNW